MVEARSKPMRRSTHMLDPRPNPMSRSTRVVKARSKSMSRSTHVLDARPEPMSRSTHVLDARPEPMSRSTRVLDARPNPMSSSRNRRRPCPASSGKCNHPFPPSRKSPARFAPTFGRCPTLRIGSPRLLVAFPSSVTRLPQAFAPCQGSTGCRTLDLPFALAAPARRDHLGKPRRSRTRLSDDSCNSRPFFGVSLRPSHTCPRSSDAGRLRTRSGFGDRFGRREPVLRQQVVDPIRSRTAASLRSETYRPACSIIAAARSLR